MSAEDPNNYNPESLAWIKPILFSLFAAFGGLMGHIMRSFDRREKVVWYRALVESLAAGFVGALVYLLCQAMELNDQWAGVIVGVSGWLGANATIRMLESVVLKKLGIDKPIAPPVRERKDDNRSGS